MCVFFGRGGEGERRRGVRERRREEGRGKVRGSVNRTPSHVTFSRTCMHSFQCRT